MIMLYVYSSMLHFVSTLQHNETETEHNKKDGYRKRNVRQFLQSAYRHILASCVRSWDNRGKCHTDEKRIQCLSNASQHVPIYLQPFTSYIARYWSEIATFSYPLHLALPFGILIEIPGKSLILRKLESWGY